MRTAHLLALVVLVLVLAGAYACYSTVRDVRAKLLGPGLQRGTAGAATP